MAKRKHTPEEIINKLREAEVVIAAGSTVAEASRRIGVSKQTFYRWPAEYGGLKCPDLRPRVSVHRVDSKSPGTGQFLVLSAADKDQEWVFAGADCLFGHLFDPVSNVGR